MKEVRAPLRQVLNSLAREHREEKLMTTIAEAYIEKGREWGLREGKAKGQAEGRAEGQAQGRAEGVLRILAVRGIAVDERVRTRVLSCKDLDQLGRWFDQALSATSLAELENL